MKKIKLNTCFLIMCCAFLFSCEKEAIIETITSNDGVQARLAYTEKGYSELEVAPIVKIKCYFPDWEKSIMTPVSGLFDYLDSDDNWVASINFGDGSCDQWATKTWDVDVFPEYPDGTADLSVFDYKHF